MFQLQLCPLHVTKINLIKSQTPQHCPILQNYFHKSTNNWFLFNSYIFKTQQECKS